MQKCDNVLKGKEQQKKWMKIEMLKFRVKKRDNRFILLETCESVWDPIWR